MTNAKTHAESMLENMIHEIQRHDAEAEYHGEKRHHALSAKFHLIKALSAATKAYGGLSEDLKERIAAIVEGSDLSESELGRVSSNDVVSAIRKVVRENEKRAWAADQLVHRVSATGREVDRKQIHNSIAYLFRKGELKRIGRGRYMFAGAGIVTSDEIMEEEDLSCRIG